MKNNFAGQDGFVWWKGIVENRLDPLKLGRCQVRIFGWHSENIEDQPTTTLPWAHPIIPLDSGKNTIGPKERDMVFGFFADAERGQKPMMIGIIGGIAEETSAHPDEKIGFSDLRSDEILMGHQQPGNTPDYNNLQSQDGDGTTVTEYAEKSRYPESKFLKEPYTSRYARGFSNGIILRTTAYDPEAKLTEPVETFPVGPEYGPDSALMNLPPELIGDIKLPQGDTAVEKRKEEIPPAIELGTVIYQNKEGEDSYSAAGTVLWEQAGEIFLVDVFGKFESGNVYGDSEFNSEIVEVVPQNMGHLYRSILRPKILNALQQKYTPIGEHIKASGEFAAFKESMGGSFSEPLPAYSAKYPYNHVYESESGNLLEFDDTPGFERIHLYHRSGTFDEIHPTGLRVKKTANDDYTYYLKNEYKHTEGKAFHTIDKGFKLLVNKDGGMNNEFVICVGEGSNLNITTAGGQVNVYATKEMQIFSDSDVNIDCENAQIHARNDFNIHAEGDAEWHIEGNLRLTVDEDFYQVVGKDKTTHVSNTYLKTVSNNYKTLVANQIVEISGADNITQSSTTITEMSAGRNTRTSASYIVDASSAYFNWSVISHIEGTGGTNTTMAAANITELTSFNLSVSDNKLDIAGTSTNVSTISSTISGGILHAAGAITQFGFITSNTIVHGSGLV